MIAILWRLISYWRFHKPVVVVAFAVVLAGLAFQLATPAVVAYAIDTGIGSLDDGTFAGSQSTLLRSALIIVALQGGRGICGYFQSYLGEYLSHALLDGWNELERDGSAYHRVDELEAFASLERLDPQEDLTELSGASRLFLVSRVSFGLSSDRLAVRNARQLQIHFDAESAFELGDRHFDM